MVNSRRMRAAKGLYKKSPHLHDDARGKERFCPRDQAFLPSRRPPSPPPPLCTHGALWESGHSSHALPVGYLTHSLSHSTQTREKFSHLPFTPSDVRDGLQRSEVKVSMLLYFFALLVFTLALLPPTVVLNMSSCTY